MTFKHWALIIGGVIPGIGLGIAALFQKLSGHAGIATGPFLIVAGIVITFIGMGFLYFERDFSISSSAVGYTICFGLFWALSSGLISVSLRRLGGAISQIVPLYNMNTLVAVFLGMIVLSEWKTVHPVKIVAASLLIITGGVLASRS